MDAIFTSGIFMSFFIVFLLFTKKNKALTDRILAAWVAIMGIHLLGYYLYHLGFWELYPHLIGVTAPFPLLHGPMLYLYTLYSLRNDSKIRRIDYLHFAPVAIAYLYMAKFFFFYTIEQKRMVDRGEIDDFGLFSSILLIGFVVSGLSYSILAYRLTWKHKRQIDDNFSYDEGINLDWLRYCIWAIGIIFLTVTIILVTRELFEVPYSFNADYIFYTLIIVFIFYIGYFGIRHQDMFTHNVKDLKSSPPLPDEKYKKSGLNEALLEEGHQKLLDFMHAEKPFLDPKLTLSGLASALNMSPNQLSQIINQQEQMNFHDFVNRYRVDEFIHRASQNNRFSILAHALDSGFNSKSSFNSIFKKHKDRTPSQYIAQLGAEKPTL
ncbi:helix-turn-helix domain-containing protein [uncultured Sunxiuqinia sp.]|uniref:helix-turn-helix domain-containing protein n=1 Tax=uncultured Sunxiuqinia sp. TaxID=1573825 RepID=UPI0030DCCDFD|tara:strand:+ start:93237 stop:94376 length:1140 start_codon:yes stop_codon:yes gene_type:complete